VVSGSVGRSSLVREPDPVRLSHIALLMGTPSGWSGIIPGAGDIVDASLNYALIVRPATELDIPKDLLSKMLVNNAISAGLGFIPLVGDIGLAAWRANSRNAHL